MPCVEIVENAEGPPAPCVALSTVAEYHRWRYSEHAEWMRRAVEACRDIGCSGRGSLEVAERAVARNKKEAAWHKEAWLACCGGRGPVYLATPYSHPDKEIREQRFREVSRVAGDMMRRGEHVFSPISHTHPIAVAGNLPGEWAYWRTYNTVMMQSCSRLVVLMQAGWRESAGVRAEIDMAREMGLPVEFMQHSSPLCGQKG